ncbi:hypothetical protein GCM10018781_28470 [Kitasatospora indigofera]|uniref:Uncharacterized protein n=1 Tax=Kitasatospora indigofera TaxID=67307 RepID=A0A919FNK7_9ACTN|nr:hypothetical protein [Kitasatospora indigofera]GHH69652.1 hypothetical protein GCM10018781_28470 [Kitasatospora indigofera]
MDNGINRVGDGWDIHSMRGNSIGEVIIGNVLRLHTGSNRIEVDVPVSSDAFGWVIGLRDSSFISSLPGGGVRMPDRPQT